MLEKYRNKIQDINVNEKMKKTKKSGVEKYNK